MDAPLPGPGGAPTVGSIWADVRGAGSAEALLEWPADVFALAGTVLRRTHAYRFAVSPPMGRHWPPRQGWDQIVAEAAEQWCTWLDQPGGEPPALLTEAFTVLRKEASTPLEDVRHGENWSLV